MTLTKRASDFLLKSEREDLQLTSFEIRNVFNYNDAPIFDSVIEFQQKYGGYVFYAGFVPIKFSLIKGAGGYPKFSKTAIVEFEESGSSLPKYFFDCATTDYQMQYFLDESGIYYEDYVPRASSFDKTVEHLALWEEIQNRKNFELLFSDRSLRTDSVDKELGLGILPEASDEYTSWFSNENIYMQQWQGKTTLFVSKDYPEKSKLLAL